MFRNLNTNSYMVVLTWSHELMVLQRIVSISLYSSSSDGAFIIAMFLQNS